jgi:hypothetical protein
MPKMAGTMGTLEFLRLYSERLGFPLEQKTDTIVTQRKLRRRFSSEQALTGSSSDGPRAWLGGPANGAETVAATRKW